MSIVNLVQDKEKTENKNVKSVKIILILIHLLSSKDNVSKKEKSILVLYQDVIDVT
jgi:hypothetical protein